MSCGVSHRCDLDPALLWLWRRLVAIAPIGPLAWEPLCAAECSPRKGKKTKRQKKKKKKTPKCGPEVLFSVPQEKKAVMCFTEKIHVLHKFHSGMSYSPIGSKFNVYKSTIQSCPLIFMGNWFLDPQDTKICRYSSPLCKMAQYSLCTLYLWVLHLWIQSANCVLNQVSSKKIHT